MDSTRQLKENYQSLAASNAQRVKSVIFDTTNMFTNSANYMSTDDYLRSVLTVNYSTVMDAQEAMNSYTYIDHLKKQETSIYNITIYTTNPTITDYQNFVYADKTIQKKSWFTRALNQPNEFWITDNSENINKLTLYKILPLPLSNYKAVLKMEVDYNYLKNRMNTQNYYTELQVNQNKIFYSDILQNVGHSQTFTIKNPNKNAFEKFIDIKSAPNTLVAVNHLTLSNETDQINIYSADFSAYTSLKKNVVRWSSILVLILLTTLIIVVAFANFFSHRIKNLQNAVYHASIEDYAFFNNISGNDEISKISLDFHTIIQHIKTKEEQIFQAQLSEKELLNQQQQMEFRLLAGQVNPHFLFNTLETIRMTALKNGNKDVAQAIKLLAKSMRFTLDYQGKKISMLSDELEAVKVYVRIQKMRFGDRVNYEVSISENIDSQHVEILPLLIQPLVENAITHGLEGIDEKGTVKLKIEKIAGDIILDVIDNGIGISEEKLEEIKERIEKNDIDSTKHIGLKNINNRIKMFYGEKYGLSIKSRLGSGTQVRIIINSLSE